MFAVASRKSVKRSITLRRFPSASIVSLPVSSLNFSRIESSDILVWIVLRAFPPSEPCKPAFARPPSIVSVLSSDSPASAPLVAAYFNASPRSCRFVAELFAVVASVSATRPASSASRWNDLSVLIAIPAASGTSVPVARARFMTDSIESIISSVLRPPCASWTIPAATSSAVNDMVEPSSFAFSVRSPSEAFPFSARASTARIASSNPANVFVAIPAGARTTLDAVTIPRPMLPTFSENASS